jgi:hypothetical protein
MAFDRLGKIINKSIQAKIVAGSHEGRQGGYTLHALVVVVAPCFLHALQA